MKLPLQTLLVLWIICTTNGAPYSKYGRTCKDIGCLPREVCIMAYESCSFNQQENVSCGRYPTCKKNSDAQSTQQSSGASYNPNYNSAPENTRPSNVNVNPPRAEAIDPNLVFGFPSNPNIHPQMPQQTPLDIPRLPDNRQPFPATPNQGGGGNYYNPALYPAPTPPPNVFGPYRNKNVEKATEPSLLDQFLYNKSPRNFSTVNHANRNLTLFTLLLLLIYRIRNNFV